MQNWRNEISHEIQLVIPVCSSALCWNIWGVYFSQAVDSDAGIGVGIVRPIGHYSSEGIFARQGLALRSSAGDVIPSNRIKQPRSDTEEISHLFRLSTRAQARKRTYYLAADSRLGVLRVRGGYRDSDVLRQYVLVMTPAPKGVKEDDLLRAIQVAEHRIGGFRTQVTDAHGSAQAPAPPQQHAAAFEGTEAERECVVCMSEPRHFSFGECGHSALCRGCMDSFMR